MRLHTSKLVKRYRNRTVVKRVSIEVEQGEIVGLLGPNGAGKTTSIAKLAHRFISEGKSVVLGAGDTFRAAAVLAQEGVPVKAGKLALPVHPGHPLHGQTGQRPVEQPVAQRRGQTRSLKVLRTKEWMPWSLIAAGTIIVLYSRSFVPVPHSSD